MSCPDLIPLWKQHGCWESEEFVLLHAADFTDSSNLQQLCCIFSAVNDVICCVADGIVKICIYVKETADIAMVSHRSTSFCSSRVQQVIAHPGSLKSMDLVRFGGEKTPAGNVPSNTPTSVYGSSGYIYG
jgi:hypothetical protein